MPQIRPKLSRVARRKIENDAAQSVFEFLDKGPVVGSGLTTASRDSQLKAYRARRLRDIANDLERYETFLDEDDSAMVASILRREALNPDIQDEPQAAFAKLLFEEESPLDVPEGRVGAKPRLAWANVRFAYFLLRVDHGISKTRVIELIAEYCRVDRNTAARTVGKKLPDYCDNVIAGRTHDFRPYDAKKKPEQSV